MQLVESGDVSLSTRSLGQGRPLVLLHGLALGSIASWYFPIALPLAEERRVLLYDLRGHGDSSTPATGYDLATQANDLDVMLRHHMDGEEPVDIVGHSLGAAIALHFALTRPERVRRLALVDLPFPFEEHTFVGLRGAASPNALLDEVMARSCRPGEGARRRERRQRRLFRLFLETTMVRDLVAERSPAEAALATLQIPVLLVAGLRSNCLSGNRTLQHRIPDAHLVEIDCGHEIPEEAPAALLAVLRTFFTA